jgi:hypothetical protein
LFWRVRARDAAGAEGPWASTSFSLNAKAAPTQQLPADNAQLAQPQQPPQLTWLAVNGANSYELAVGTDPNLSASTTYTTSTTSYSFTTPQGVATYYWKVRAVMGGGQATDWSGIRSYHVGALDYPTLVRPQDSPDTVLTDVLLEWSSVPGASKYEVRVSTDEAFSSSVAVATTVATRWSPPETLDNDQYWWQVRAYDSQGQTSNWPKPGSPGPDQTWQFERRWQFTDTRVLNLERPALIHPINQVAPAVEDPFYFEWEPVKLASEYKLQVGRDASFSPRTFSECSTKQTTHTPMAVRLHYDSGTYDCQPPSGGTYYWRVRAVDHVKPVFSQWSDIHTFTYRRGFVDYKAPLNGATVSVPTMSWHAALGAERYELTYSYGRYTKTISTYSTSYTPVAKVPTSTPNVTWKVQAIYANGDRSLLTYEDERSFTLVAPPTPTASAPDALTVNPSGDRFPSLNWRAVPNADHYRVWIGIAGDVAFYAPSRQVRISRGNRHNQSAPRIQEVRLGCSSVRQQQPTAWCRWDPRNIHYREPQCGHRPSCGTYRLRTELSYAL